MGTNYYVRYNLCLHCGRYEEEHIGKSSCGWCFSLHVTKHIKNLEDWKKIIYRNDAYIYNEYGECLTKDKVLDIIENRGRQQPKKIGPDFPTYGYSNWLDLLEKNRAEIGPNNLLRHKIDGIHCIGHGKGTYDFIQGDFS